jgi:RNase P subunit RPR2
MATDSPQPSHDQSEECPECERPTSHTVSIEIRTEADQEKNAKFSREPYRVAECLECGHESVVRMNNVSAKKSSRGRF